MSAPSAQGLKHLVEAIAEDSAPSALREALRSVQGELRDWEEMARQLARTEEGLLHVRKIFEEGPLGMAVLSAEGRFLKINPALCQLLDYAAGELNGLSIDHVTHPDDRSLDAAQAHQLWAGECPKYKVEKRFVRKDGQIVRARLTASVLHDDAGDPLYRLAMIEELDEPAEPGPRPRDGSLDLPASASAQCSRCRSDRLVRSRWRFLERPMILLLQRPVRCRSCGRRAFKPVWAGVPGRSEP
jgi:PAS domain S-box-containing protein